MQPPIKNTLTEKIYILNEFTLVLLQSSANSLSLGQGRDLAFHCRNPDIDNIIPANINTPNLYSENQTICGTELTTEAITAPAPKLTNNAGKAQQTSVPPDENRVSKDKYLVLTKLGCK
ncbi:hypothetical protein [Candidatus Methylopumilus universalis]|uniref:hypothetical protein n=1 Tax=Candidatus Methylopumilus universalis TaxID=2588536 RepID=UPI003BEEB6F8